MSEANKDVVRRFGELYGRAAWDELDALVTPGYVHHNNELELTLAQFKRGAVWLRAAIPDLALAAEDVVAEADRVAVRWVGRGTHAGSLFGETPTSGPIVLHGITLYRMRDGLIAEDWEAMDERDLMRQTGAVAGDP